MPPVSVDAEPGTHPVDVLLIVDRDDPPRTAGLREEAVEAVERADVEHATARETIRTEHRKAVAVVAGDPRRVDPGSEREGVKPQRNRIPDALRVRNPRADRQHVRDDPLGTRRLRDRLDRLDRVCSTRQPITSNLVHMTVTPASQVRASGCHTLPAPTP